MDREDIKADIIIILQYILFAAIITGLIVGCVYLVAFLWQLGIVGVAILIFLMVLAILFLVTV
jgi:hypothetical protein